MLFVHGKKETPRPTQASVRMDSDDQGRKVLLLLWSDGYVSVVHEVELHCGWLVHVQIWACKSAMPHVN
jgi:hypothetical protein